MSSRMDGLENQILNLVESSLIVYPIKDAPKTAAINA
ncbi:hypothetical protein ACVWXM_009995 [Bradyrhizobium sp. GM7.3]